MGAVMTPGNMIPRTLVGRGFALMLAAGVSLVLVAQASAQAVPSDEDTDPAAAEAAAPDANDADTKDADGKNLELDWSQLNVDASTLINNPTSKARPASQAGGGHPLAGAFSNKPKGPAPGSGKQPFWPNPR